MAIKGYFFNAEYDSETGKYDREYNAEDVTNYLRLIVGGGVFPNPSTNLQVEASMGMNIIVHAGSGWFADGHKIDNLSDYPLTVQGADVLLDRIDRVVFYCDYRSREVGLDIVEGTPAATPEAPALTRDTNTRYEYALADIYVAANASEILQPNITDQRANSDVCGWVAGLIQQVDTATLFIQWQTAYEEYYADSIAEFDAWKVWQKAEFDAWLDTLTEELTVETYLARYRKKVTVQGNGDHTVYFDVTGYTYDAADVFEVYVNGLKLNADEYDFGVQSGTPRLPYVTITFTEAQPTPTSPLYDNIIEVEVLKSRVGVP